MNYVAGSLDRFKVAAQELQKEAEIRNIIAAIMEDIESAVQSGKSYITVENALFDKVVDQFLYDGYTIKPMREQPCVYLSGWIDED